LPIAATAFECKKTSQSGVGGAIFSQGTLDVDGTTFSLNSAQDGGALRCDTTATITRSTFSGNSAQDGGAIDVQGSAVDLLDTTLSGNSAAIDGGAIRTNAGPVRLYNVTVTGNRADSDSNGTGKGGGIASGGNVTLVNSIVAKNEETFFFNGFHIPVDADCSGTLASTGGNIMFLKPAGCTVNGAITIADPKLGPLQLNGGPTKTHALLAGSPAIDGGSLSGCVDPVGTPLGTDQRGAKRVVGVRCDSGASERTPCGDADGDGSVNVGDVFYVVNYLFAAGPVPVGLANVNGDATIDVNDVFFLINALFANGQAPSCLGI